MAALPRAETPERATSPIVDSAELMAEPTLEASPDPSSTALPSAAPPSSLALPSAALPRFCTLPHTALAQSSGFRLMRCTASERPAWLATASTGAPSRAAPVSRSTWPSRSSRGAAKPPDER